MGEMLIEMRKKVGGGNHLDVEAQYENGSHFDVAKQLEFRRAKLGSNPSQHSTQNLYARSCQFPT
jgi:hypothetical protein